MAGDSNNLGVRRAPSRQPLRPARPAHLLSRSAAGRRLWLTLHKYAGLFLGALFVLVGLTGSILAFWQPVDEWLNAEIMRVDVPPLAIYRPLDEILAAAKIVLPPAGVPITIVMPRHPGAAVNIIYRVEAGAQDSNYYELFVDPYTAQTTGQRVLQRGSNPFSMPFVQLVMSLHYTLLFGHEQSYVAGIPAIFLLVSVLIGLYLWWPRNGNWRHALTVKRGGSAGRLTLDIHKTVGLYLSAVLIVLLFSGIYMIFKPQVRAMVAWFSPVREEPQDLKSTPIPGQPRLGLDAAAAIAGKVFPDGKLRSLMLPVGPEGVYVIGKQADDEPNRASTNRNVTIDPYSGLVLHVQDRAKFTAGETFLEWQYPLHCGEAFGNTGRAFIMVMGFVPLILYATGVIRWLQKRRARRHGKGLTSS